MQAESNTCSFGSRKYFEIEAEMQRLRQEAVRFGLEQSKIITAGAIGSIPITIICIAASAPVLP